jgi:hypothetical protein
MKTFSVLAAVVAVVVLVMASAPPALARNGWGLEDPQLCVNHQLLTVMPAAPTDVFVQVPKQANFGYSGCGLDPDIPVVPIGNVSVQGVNFLRVSVQSRDGTAVVFTWGDETVVGIAEDGVATAKFNVK